MNQNMPITDEALFKINKGIEEGRFWLVYRKVSVFLNHRNVRQFETKAEAIRSTAKSNKSGKCSLVYVPNIQDALRQILL